nr:hypothetical protein [Mycobacteroides abscessus]
MTTLEDVAKKKAAEQSAVQQAAVELVRLAQEQVPVADRARRVAQSADQDGARDWRSRPRAVRDVASCVTATARSRFGAAHCLV